MTAMDRPTAAPALSSTSEPELEFASLPLARASLARLRETMQELTVPALIERLPNIGRVYREFPELELDYPRSRLSEPLGTMAAKLPDEAAVLLLRAIVAFDPACPSCLASLLERVGRLKNAPPAAELLSDWLAATEVDGEPDPAVDDALARALAKDRPGDRDGGALATVVRSAKRRLSPAPQRGTPLQSPDALLRMAERFRTAPPPRPEVLPGVAWHSGPVSFEEFVLQWPSEITLSSGLDDEAFITEAHRAILLRPPGRKELDEYLGVLRRRAASRPWIIENLLSSEELRSLERRVRVICDGEVVTEPGRLEYAAMAVIALPAAAC